MATRASLKALITAAENLNTTNIVSGGNITAATLQNIITNITSFSTAIVNALFDADEITRVTGTLSSAMTLQNAALIGVDLSQVVLFVDLNEITSGRVSAFDNVTGTLTFTNAISGAYKLIIIGDAGS